jgi:hypothetical protein
VFPDEFIVRDIPTLKLIPVGENNVTSTWKQLGLATFPPQYMASDGGMQDNFSGDLYCRVGIQRTSHFEASN